MGLEWASVRPFTLSNMNISKTSRPIIIKLYQKHSLGGGLPTSGFEADRSGTLVAMAIDASHRLN